jgi:hypothetical protein
MIPDRHLVEALAENRTLTLDLQNLVDAVRAGQQVSAEDLQHVYRLSLSVYMHTAKASCYLERTQPERRTFHVERLRSV